MNQEIERRRTFAIISHPDAGKTTLTRGIAKGLGVDDSVTSPSFTLSKEYYGQKYRLVHYDFYRLPDPGLMVDDLAESIADPDSIVIVEWADTVENILPADCMHITINYNDDNSREVIL